MKKLIVLSSMLFCFGVFASSAQTATVERKAGWSQPKKGAVIGGLAGAATGAAVSRRGHKGSGALIGGAVGAGAGYAYGKHRQKRHPRYTTKTKVISSN